MEKQILISERYAEKYEHYENSVGNNLQFIQITTKCRYEIMRGE
jgi:hypothetical protein